MENTCATCGIEIAYSCLTNDGYAVCADCFTRETGMPTSSGSHSDTNDMEEYR